MAFAGISLQTLVGQRAVCDDITLKLLSAMVTWLNGKNQSESQWALKTKIAQYMLADLRNASRQGSIADQATISCIEEMIGAMECRDRICALEAGTRALKNKQPRNSHKPVPSN
jgi:hypothetical protein